MIQTKCELPNLRLKNITIFGRLLNPIKLAPNTHEFYLHLLQLEFLWKETYVSRIIVIRCLQGHVLFATFQDYFGTRQSKINMRSLSKFGINRKDCMSLTFWRRSKVLVLKMDHCSTKANNNINFFIEGFKKF